MRDLGYKAVYECIMVELGFPRCPMWKKAQEKGVVCRRLSPATFEPSTLSQ